MNHLVEDTLDGHQSFPPDEHQGVGHLILVRHQFIEHAEARSIDVLVGQEIILVPFKCSVSHLVHVWGYKQHIDRARTGISWHDKRLRF